jgi:hypothetical protein
MPVWSILAIGLLVGIAFVLVPQRSSRLEQRPLSTARIEFSEVEHLIQLVSNTHDGETIDDLLQYKIANQILSSTENRCRKIVLVAGGIDRGPKSSLDNAHQIQDLFQDNSQNVVDISVERVPKIQSPNETYEKVLNAVHAATEKTGPNGKILCDFTGGNKMMSLGMALAAFGNAKLVYCVDDPSNDRPSHYIEINANATIEEMIDQI